MDLLDFKERLKEIIPRKFTFSDEEIKKFFRNSIYKDFRRSLEVLASAESLAKTNLSEIELLILLFKEVVGIEMLVKERSQYENKEMFSTHSAKLLATNKNQLFEIQYYLGRLYELRSCIVHSLSLKNCQVFETYFKNNIQKAIKCANTYHRLILLRHIERTHGIIPKNFLIAQLDQLRQCNRWDLPLSRYYHDIAKELYEITRIPSSYPKEAKALFFLPPPEECGCYRLGINSYGGLSELTHSEIEDYEPFRDNNELVIPDKLVWEEFCRKIDLETNKICRGTHSEVRIVPKTHQSILFYIGYRFHYRRNVTLLIDFNRDEIELTPLNEIVYPKEHWLVKTNEVKPNHREAIVILNVTHSIDADFKKERTLLNLQKVPHIIFDYKFRNLATKPNQRWITSEKELKKACKAIEQYFTKQKETQSIHRVHLFTRAPGAMMILLGMHFRRRKLNVVLYEFGKSSADDVECYHNVLECKP